MDNSSSSDKKNKVRSRKVMHAPELAFVFVLLGILIMRIPVFLNIGDDGSGLFGIGSDLFMIVYMSFAVSMTYTVKASVTSCAVKAQYQSAIKNVKAGIWISIIYALSIGGLLTATAGPFADVILGESRAQMVIYAAIPAIVFSLLSSAIKGYILGCRLSGLYCAGNFLEAVFLVLFSMIGSGLGSEIGGKASVLLVNNDIRFIYGAAGAMAGVSAAELLCFIYWIITMIVFIRPMKSLAGDDNTTGGGSVSGVMRILFGRIFPILVIGLVISSYFPISMRIFGASYKDKSKTLALFGEYNAIYLSMISLGSTVCFLAAAGRIKAILGAQKKDEQNKMNRILNSSFRFLLVASIPVMLYLTALGGNIASLFGVKDTAMISGYFYFYSILTVSSAVWLFTSVILLESGYISDVIMNTVISYVISLLFAVTLISGMQSMAGAIIGMLIFTVMNGIFSGTLIRKKMGMRIRITSYFGRLVICWAICLGAVFGLKLLLTEYVGDLAAVLVCAIAGWLLYVFLIAQFRVIPDRQICHMPCGEVIIMFMRGGDSREE